MAVIVLGTAMIFTVVDHRNLQCKEEPVRLTGESRKEQLVSGALLTGEAARRHECFPRPGDW